MDMESEKDSGGKDEAEMEERKIGMSSVTGSLLLTVASIVEEAEAGAEGEDREQSEVEEGVRLTLSAAALTSAAFFNATILKHLLHMPFCFGLP